MVCQNKVRKFRICLHFFFVFLVIFSTENVFRLAYMTMTDEHTYFFFV